MGNAQLGLALPIEGLTAGATYYWSVRAVDNAFAGSPFTAEASFVVPAPAQIQSAALDVNGAITMQWIVTPGLSYRVEVSSDFANWSTLKTITGAAGTGIVEVTQPIGPDTQKQFYRVVFL
jgi:hypothetical protein